MFEFQKREKALIVIALLFIFAVSALPAIRSGVYLGHDLPFHLGRIQSISEELANGQFPDMKVVHGKDMDILVP